MFVSDVLLSGLPVSSLAGTRTYTCLVLLRISNDDQHPEDGSLILGEYLPTESKARDELLTVVVGRDMRV
jgi:hypothetical protein